jgi:hypothetical protein
MTAKMKRIPTQIVKNRSRKLTKLFESFTPYTTLVGQTMQVDVFVESNHALVIYYR